MVQFRKGVIKMKYLWIVMLMILYSVWLIATIKDIHCHIKGIWKFPYWLNFLEWYSYLFIIGHLLFMFGYSVLLYLYE